MHFYYLAILFVTIATPIVKMVLRSVGVGAVTYYGINVILGQAKDYIISSIGHANPALQGIMGLAKLDVAINIYLAAITTRLVLAGMDKVSGKFKQMRARSATSGTLEA